MLMVSLCSAQTYIMDGTPINDCSGFFSDSGGNAGPYDSNENLTTTICPDFTTGTHIQLIFSGVDLAAGDMLCFFDGDDATAPPISCAADFDPGSPFIIQATAVNIGGCLTITFNSNATLQGDGWSADINCIPACQTILADLVMTSPEAMPADTGWIDICPGEGISFEGAGLYPQDGAVYNHSDLTSSFTWSFGDGTTSQGPTAFHTYNEPGGYIVQLLIEDQFGCRNSNFISQRVRVSTYPDFDLAGDIPANLCANDTINLSAVVATIDSTYEVSVSSTEGTFQTTGVVSDSLPLPDGTGSCYETSILFADFAPGQVLTDINDLLSVCINVEHSYMRDLYITLTCPDGTEVILQDQTNAGGEVFLGVPYELDDIGTPDPPEPGVGWDYCWTPNATMGTWLEYANANAPNTLPEGDYNSFESLDAFLGCPLNGEWTIQICDNWGSDNGWLFEWSISFASDLYPNIETFTPEIIDWGWNDNPSIFFETQDSISAAPMNAGSASYTFFVSNDFGCTYDTTVIVEVLPPTHPSCHSCDGTLQQLTDTTLCTGDMVMLNAEVPNQLSNQEVTFEAFANITFDNNIYPPGAPYESVINVSNINPGTIIDATAQIISVCLDLTHPYDSDVELYLEAPNGTVLTLSSDNGGGGDNYTNTCFTPTATLPITGGTAPFTGDFLPEGNFTDLNGTPVAGSWILQVSDDQNGFAGNFLGWTITFENENNISYEWSPAIDLSCSNCPDPEVSPTQTTSYVVTSTDDFNCSFSDSLNIVVVDALVAPIVDCGPNGTGELLFTWGDVAGASGYEISIDGGMTWIPANGSLSHLITGIPNGATVDILIRGTSGGGSCDPEVATSSCMLVDCTMALDTSFTVPPSCYNTADGSALMSTSGAALPVQYFVDGGAAPGSNINLLAPGLHTVVAIDAAGCTDTINFILPSPDTIMMDLQIDSVNCFGFNDGQATANATGGTGTFNYIWNTIPSTSDAALANLSVGSYTVTASDANGCSIVAVAEIAEPSILASTIVQDSVDCNAGTNGTATVSPVGGVAPYTYLWDNTQTTSTASNLMMGAYEVTVSDANSCTEILQIDVLEPAPIFVTLTADSLTCFEASDGQMSADYLGGVGQATFNWSGPSAFSSTDQNISGLVAGNYCVTVTDENSCTNSLCFDVGSPAPIALTNPISTTPFCVGSDEGTATISPSGGSTPYQYLWGDGQTTATATGLISGNVGITITDANGCTNSESILVGTPPAVVLNLSSTMTSCANTNDGSALALASGGTGTSFAYQWDASTGSQTTDNVTALIPGNYCVTVVDNNGCSADGCIDIGSPDPVVINSAIETPLSCFGENDGQALVNVSGGSGVGTYMYVWNDSNAQFQNPAVFLSADTYTVTVTDANGCTEIASVEVTQPDTLTISTTTVDVTCFQGTNGSATVSPTGGTMPYNYAWSDFQTTETAADLTAGFYGVTVTDDNGCTALTTVSLSEPSTGITLAVSQTQVACFAANEGEALVVANGGTLGYTYDWSNGANTDLAVGLDSIDYTVTVTDALGCTAEEVISISELEEVIINVAFVEPLCFNQSNGQLGVNIISGGGGGGDPANYNYIWNTSPTQTTAYIDNIVGDVSYTVTVTDAQGCSSEEETFLGQPDEMSFDFAVTDALCFGSADGLIDITNVGSINTPISYAWDANAANQTTATATDLTLGSYNVVITDSVGCSTQGTILVEEPTPLEISFETSNNLCSGDTIGTIVTTAAGGVPDYNFNWSNGMTTGDLIGLETGSYNVTLTDANSCELISSVDITQPSQISASFTSEDVTCFGDQDGSVQIFADGGALPYEYSFDESEFNGVNNVVGLEAGAYEVTIVDANGCSWSSIASVDGPPEVEADAGPDITLGLGETADLGVTTTNAVGNVEVSWSAPYAGTLFCPDSTEICPSPQSITLSTITYEVYVIDENGCDAVDNITVFVEKERQVFVPTGFTPNNDNINSLLIVHGRKDTEVKVFRVYDRWGNMVYEGRDFMVGDLDTGWDGTFKGKQMQSGVYVWYLEALFIDGYEEIYKGQTTLLR